MKISNYQGDLGDISAKSLVAPIPETFFLHRERTIHKKQIQRFSRTA